MSKLTCCVAVAVAGLGGQAVAAIINVPGDFSTIQAAVFAANSGDEVVVAPGTYVESFTYTSTTDVDLRSSNGPHETFIDGYIIFNGSQSPDSVLEGFTFSGQQIEPPIKFAPGSPTIRNCIFAANTAGEGAMYILGDTSSPVITGCLFDGNMVRAAIGIPNGAWPTITDCTFVNNEADIGGAISIAKGGLSPPVVVNNCTFVQNNAQFGGAIYISEFSIAIFTNCLFADNIAEAGGGAIFISQSTPILTNCTFSDNTAGIGGGIYNDDFSFPTVRNSIFWNNFPFQIVDSDSLSAVTYSLVQGGWANPVSHHIIDADPQFVEPAIGDFHLQSGSPATDAGHNWDIAGTTDTDFDGNPRFADDPATADTGCGLPVVVDMGAYEFQGNPATVKLGDIDGDGAVAVPDLLTLLAAWGPAGGGCQLADFDLDGVVGVPDLLILLANWG